MSLLAREIIVRKVTGNEPIECRQSVRSGLERTSRARAYQREKEMATMAQNPDTIHPTCLSVSRSTKSPRYLGTRVDSHRVL